MRNAFLFIAIVSFFSFSSFAQEEGRISVNSKKENLKSTPENSSTNEETVIVSYQVVEKVNGSVTTYNVSHISLIDTYDLGKNNSRVITPKYGKVKTKRKIALINEPTKAPLILNAAPPLITNAAKVDPIAIPQKKITFIMVDILSTYERILEKGGYESVDMLKKVANMRYFKGDLAIAAKWYSQLFALTTDLENVYYYRYAQGLIATGRNEKGNEMMKVFLTKKP